MEKSRKELNKIKKNNAKMYPMYKMLSWDLLFFFSVEFLIYTITKKVTPSDILLINAFYLLFRTLMQIPAVMITDFLGKKKSIVLGNICWMFFVIVLMMFLFFYKCIKVCFLPWMIHWWNILLFRFRFLIIKIDIF